MPDSDAYTLYRTGDVPLKVQGELVARSTSQQQPTKRELPLERRYHELTIYRTLRQQHVGHINYVTTWQGELGDALARVGTLAEVVAWFRDYDPTGPVSGFPAGRGFADRQQRLLEAIELGFDTALSTLLAGLGVSETVE